MGSKSGDILRFGLFILSYVRASYTAPGKPQLLLPEVMQNALISLCFLCPFITGRRFLGVLSAASLALWQSYRLRYLTPPERTSDASKLVTPGFSVPLGISALVIFSSSYSGSSVTLFGLPSPLRMTYWLLALYAPLQLGAVSPKFSPPVCYQLSLA